MLTVYFQVKFDYGKVGKINMFSLRRTNLVSNEILEQWSIALIYEAASWISDTIKLKATRTAPNEKITKVNLLYNESTFIYVKGLLMDNGVLCRFVLKLNEKFPGNGTS